MTSGTELLPAVTAAERAALRRSVRAFADAGLRDLPWRRTRDPWAVLVSELMLQQTQVARVAVAFGPFVARFPTPTACAAQAPGEVVRAWAGLGYNRRAVHLHAAATAMVARHDGRVPCELAALESLPGVGPYTARAVLAFAFESPVAVVDVNVARVLSRAVAGRPLSARQVQSLADALVDRRRPWAWNQALMEIGARHCTRRPDCGGCPLARRCTWRRAGDDAPDPARPPTRQAPFAGSDRQARGRLVAALRRAPVPAGSMARACGWPGDPVRARVVADALVRDGVAVADGRGGLRLP